MFVMVHVFIGYFLLSFSLTLVVKNIHKYFFFVIVFTDKMNSVADVSSIHVGDGL